MLFQLLRGVLLLLALFQTNSGPQDVTEQAAQKLQAGDFQAAATIVRAGLAVHPKEVELWNLLGIAESELKHTNQAQEAFNRGLQLAPDSVSLNENVGFLFYRLADYPTAAKYLGHAVALGSDKPGVRFSLAASLLRSGQSAHALEILQSLENALSQSPDYWEERGRAESALDPSAASASFDRALALSPSRAAALNGKASLAEKDGHDEAALSFLIKARAANPDDLPTLLHFAMVCLRLDLGPDAIAALEHARQLDQTNNAALYLLARANISVGNWAIAHDLFTAFSHRVPDFAPVYFALGWLDLKLNRVSDARAELEHCLSLAPKLADARYELAELDRNDGQLAAAEKQLEIVLAQNPNHAQANLSLADLRLREGKLAEAQALLETALRADPQLAAAHYKLAQLFAREHRENEAGRERELAATLNANAAQQNKIQRKLVLPESAGNQ